MLKYECPQCGSEILVRFLSVGETAVCKNCGSRSPIPSSAVETDVPSTVAGTSSGKPEVNENISPQGPHYAGMRRPINPARTAWDPKRLKWIAFFFTFFPALILAAYNWERLGFEDRKRPLLVIAALVFPIWFAIIYLSASIDGGGHIDWVFGALNYAVGAYVGSRQKSAYEQFISSGGQSRGYFRVVVNSIFFVAAFFALMIGLVFVEDHFNAAEFERGYEMIESDQDSNAVTILGDLRDYYEDEPLLWYYLGVAYAKLGEYDSATASLVEARKLDPDDLDFKALQTYIYEDVGWRPNSGYVVTWYGSGNQKLRCSYMNGMLQGEYVENWPDGMPRRKMYYVDGVADGPFEVRYADQSMQVQGEAVSGKLHGPIIRWDPETGMPETTAVYDSGVLLHGVNMEDVIR